MWTSKRHYNLDTIPINHIKKLFKRLAFQDITSHEVILSIQTKLLNKDINLLRVELAFRTFPL